MNRRLLILTPRFPYPLYGGDVLRIYRLCEALQMSFRLTLLSICQTQAELHMPLPADSPFTEVHRVFLPKWRSMANAAGAIITGKAMQVAYYDSRTFEAAVSRLQGQHDYLLCHLARTAPYAQNFQGTRILELTDHIPLTYARSNALQGKFLSLRRLIYTLEKDRIDAFQNHTAHQFDLITFVSEVDRQMFLKSSGASPEKVATFGNGINLVERPFQPNRAGRTIAFIGTLKSMPNADAVSYFISEILPIIRQQQPDVTFRVVGMVDDKFRSRYEKQGIEFTGAVADLAQSVDDCVLGVCPMRIGAGVQNKMLDYMALGLPTVTTSIGAEGLRSGAFTVADAPKDFAQAILLLLANSSSRATIARAGRQLIENGYSWSARLESFPARILASA